MHALLSRFNSPKDANKNAHNNIIYKTTPILDENFLENLFTWLFINELWIRMGID